MKYFEFLDDIIANFRVSKMIEIIKIEQNLEDDELLVVAYEATRALIVVANYKTKPAIEMPLIQGFSQLDFIKQIISLEENSKQSSVKFKKNDDGIAIETSFKIDNTNIKNKNVAQSLLPATPKKLSDFASAFEVDLDAELIADILRKLSLSIFNVSVFVTKNNKNKLSLKLTNDVDVVDIDLPFDVDEDVLTEPFKIDLDRLISILKIGSGGVKFAISEKQNLARIIKNTDVAEYKYYLIKKAS
jgi:hypothetical protein